MDLISIALKEGPAPAIRRRAFGLGPMPRTYLVFGDIEGKLDVLRVECNRCDRKGRYSVAKLIEKHGRNGNMMKWRVHHYCSVDVARGLVLLFGIGAKAFP